MLFEDPAENYQAGYIKVFRSIKGHWIWNESRVKSKLEAWIYLLLEAQWSPEKRSVGYDLIELERGQLLTSQEKLSMEWGWNRGAVRSFLDMLKKDAMISQESTTKYTKITICKYDSYQGLQPTNNQQTTNKPTTNQQQLDTYKKDNKEKKERKEEISESYLKSYEQYIEGINSLLGKKYKGSTKDKTGFIARIKEGRTLQEILSAVNNASKESYHIENGFKYLTPEFFTRSDKLDKFCQVSLPELQLSLKPKPELQPKQNFNNDFEYIRHKIEVGVPITEQEQAHYDRFKPDVRPKSQLS